MQQTWLQSCMIRVDLPHTWRGSLSASACQPFCLPGRLAVQAANPLTGSPACLPVGGPAACLSAGCAAVFQPVCCRSFSEDIVVGFTSPSGTVRLNPADTCTPGPGSKLVLLTKGSEFDNSCCTIICNPYCQPLKAWMCSRWCQGQASAKDAAAFLLVPCGGSSHHTMVLSHLLCCVLCCTRSWSTVHCKQQAGSAGFESAHV